MTVLGDPHTSSLCRWDGDWTGHTEYSDGRCMALVTSGSTPRDIILELSTGASLTPKK